MRHSPVIVFGNEAIVIIIILVKYNIPGVFIPLFLLFPFFIPYNKVISLSSLRFLPFLNFSFFLNKL